MTTYLFFVCASEASSSGAVTFLKARRIPRIRGRWSKSKGNDARRGIHVLYGFICISMTFSLFTVARTMGGITFERE